MKKSSRFGSTLGLALALTLDMTAPLAVLFSAPAIAQQKFSDVPADQPYAPYINRLTDSSLNVIKGFPDGTFRPNDPVTRAQFAAMLHQSFASGYLAPPQSFADVPANYWAADAITAARQDRFLSGYPGNEFRPEQLITRAEVLVSLVNGIGYAGGSPANLAFYRDADEVPAYARSAIANADFNRLTNISGFPPGFADPYDDSPYSRNTPGDPLSSTYRDLNHLYPNLPATRAEAAGFIGQAFVNLSTVPPVPSLALEWPKERVITLATSASQVGVSNNGQRVVTLSDDAQTIQVWDTQTSQSTVKIYRDNGGTHFNSVAISADGARIAAIAQTAPALTHLEAYMWDAETGEQLWSQSLNYLPGDLDSVVIDTLTKIAFSPDGSKLLAKFNRDFNFKGTGEQRIQLLDVATGEIVQTLQQKTDVTGRRYNDIQQFEFSPDGTLLAGATYSAGPEGVPAAGIDISVWQLSDGTRLDTFSSDGSFVWMGFMTDNRVRLFVQKEGKQQQDIWNPYETEVTRAKIAFPMPSGSRADETFPEYLSRDGQYVYINGDPAGGKLANTSTFEVRYLSDTPDKAANFSDNGDYLAIANNQTVKVFASVREK